ncbi:MAG: RES family NAD+ phosphorylase [Bryobacterales bacterium]|nr:RES family NAD+ phosphorylase [Bryobacterales bacterium]
MVYASTSLALAAVETFVNLEPKLRPADLVALSGTIPSSIPVERLDCAALPARWFASRDESLRAFGDQWIQRGSSSALLVPSAAIRGDWNILLNPEHPDFSSIQLRKPEPFRFDLRLFRA